MNESCKEILQEKEEYLETLTVNELVKALERFPGDMKVFTTWESTVHSLLEHNVYEALTGSLYLDADENFYKKDFKK